MISSATLDLFTSVLTERLEKGIFTTEDSIRYLFFLSIIESKAARANDVVLEMRHPCISGAQIDMWIETQSKGNTAIEFKYDRPIPSQKNAPRTQKAGKVFNDLRRLSMLNAAAWFVYVTDGEMYNYFKNPPNGLDDFFSESEGETMLISPPFLGQFAKTFMNTCGGPFTANLWKKVAMKLPNGHHLRVYQVIA